MRDQHVVIDDSALLDLLVSRDVGLRVWGRLGGCVVHAPCHIDAEVFSGLGRLAQTGVLTPGEVLRHADAVAAAPIERHAVAELLAGAWSRRDDVPWRSVLYVELANRLGMQLLTTDPAVARIASVAECVT
jgi:predicted nucleic acid-binding protein